MKISTKARYSLCFLLDLALHATESAPVSLRDIATRQGISEKYLWQVVTPLRAANVIRSVRGAQGGFALARRLEDISLADLMTLLEDGFTAQREAAQGRGREGAVARVAQEAWRDLEGKVVEVMRGMSLAELVKRCQEQSERDWSYSI